MSRLTNQDREAISRALHEIYKVRDLDGFVVTAMRELPRLIEADVAGYNEVNYRERRMLCITDSATVQRFYHERRPVFEANMLQNPLVAHYAKTPDKPLKISDFLNVSEWRDTSVYQTYYGSFGAEYQIAVVLQLEQTLQIAFAFNRKVSDFTERHRAMLTALQPHLTQAYENARTYTQTESRIERRDRMLSDLDAGWIDVDPHWRVIDATAQARSNLGLFFPNHDQESDRLPSQIEDWAADNLAEARSGKPVERLVIANQYGRLSLQLWASDAIGDCSILTELVLEASSPRPLKKLGLTERQAEVLYWLSYGKSNAEIAIILKISVRTVVFHVSSILEVLGVSNRTEAGHLATTHLATQRRLD